jgi:hypothetical protein
MRKTDVYYVIKISTYFLLKESVNYLMSKSAILHAILYHHVALREESKLQELENRVAGEGF